MTDHALVKGANVSLLARTAATEGRLQAVVRWADPDGGTDIDVSALLLGADGQVRSDEDFVFYNAPVAADGAVRLLGKRADDAAGEDGVAVDLETLPDGVERILIAASIDPDSRATGFGDVEGLGLVLLGGGGQRQAVQARPRVGPVPPPQRGFVPEGLLNYLALLGWAIAEDRGVFTMDEMVAAVGMRASRAIGASRPPTGESARPQVHPRCSHGSGRPADAWWRSSRYGEISAP